MKKITLKHINEVCKLGQGKKVCGFLLLDENGMNCAKTNIVVKHIIQQKRKKGTMVATGDNCNGREGTTNI